MKRHIPFTQAVIASVVGLLLSVLSFNAVGTVFAVTNPQNGSVGVEATIPTPPPKTGATITVPSSGQTFSKLPVTISGICPKGLLVKLFKNNVFAGSEQCQTGSYSIQADLFNGRNDLIARVYDALDQSGPDSNTVTVTFNDAGYVSVGPRISITSSYAKRGANPGQTLVWPIELSGGTSPYAISADWGDGKSPDLISQQYPGEVVLKHSYDSPGVYNIIVKATDKNGNAAFLQIVGIGNGALSQDTTSSSNNNSSSTTIIKLVWWPLAVLVPLILLSFWLGSRHRLTEVRKKLEQGKMFDE